VWELEGKTIWMRCSCGRKVCRLCKKKHLLCQCHSARARQGGVFRISQTRRPDPIDRVEGWMANVDHFIMRDIQDI